MDNYISLYIYSINYLAHYIPIKVFVSELYRWQDKWKCRKMLIFYWNHKISGVNFHFASKAFKEIIKHTWMPSYWGYHNIFFLTVIRKKCRFFRENNITINNLYNICYSWMQDKNGKKFLLVSLNPGSQTRGPPRVFMRPT